jgi:hypothetical protein
MSLQPRCSRAGFHRSPIVEAAPRHLARACRPGALVRSLQAHRSPCLIGKRLRKQMKCRLANVRQRGAGLQGGRGRYSGTVRPPGRRRPPPGVRPETRLLARRHRHFGVSRAPARDRWSFPFVPPRCARRLPQVGGTELRRPSFSLRSVPARQSHSRRGPKPPDPPLIVGERAPGTPDCCGSDANRPLSGGETF